jgi:hypothetical protein
MWNRTEIEYPAPHCLLIALLLLCVSGAACCQLGGLVRFIGIGLHCPRKVIEFRNEKLQLC